MWGSSDVSTCCMCGGWCLRERCLERGDAKHLEAMNGAMEEGARMEPTEVDKWKIAAGRIVGQHLGCKCSVLSCFPCLVVT